MLKVFLLDESSNSHIEIKDNILPIIEGYGEYSYSRFLIKNDSIYTLNDITITFDLYDAPSYILSCVHSAGVVPKYEDFSYAEYIADSPLLKTMRPGESFALTLFKMQKTFNDNINIKHLPIDIAYVKSNIALMDIIKYYEFTEGYGATELINSLTGQVDTNAVISGDILKGDGCARFSDTEDSITVDFTKLSELSFFVHGIIKDHNGVIPFFSYKKNDNIQGDQDIELLFGLTDLRHLFLYVKDENGLSGYYVSEKYINDVYGDHWFGLSYNGKDIVMSMDGQFASLMKPTLGYPAYTGQDFKLDISHLKLFNNDSASLSGYIFETILANKYKEIIFHKEVAVNASRK